MENLQFRQHAIDCGLNMTNATAVALEDGRGYTIAHDVFDPVYSDLLVFAGTTLTLRMVQWLGTFGIDYVTVRI